MEAEKSENKGGAPLGNQNGVKLKDSEVRQLAYKQYCAHLAKGKSKKSWYFDHSEFRCTYETLERYLEDEVEFDPIHKRIAEAKGYGHWEGIVEESAIGKNKVANTASLQMLMRNKFGWDKEATKVVEIDPSVHRGHEALMKQLKGLREQYAQKK